MTKVDKLLEFAKGNCVTKVEMGGSNVETAVDIEPAAGAEDFFQFSFGGDNIGHAAGEEVFYLVHLFILAP